MALESGLTPAISNIPMWLIWAITIWDLAWRAVGVWKSTMKKQPIWSVVFVLFQTLGILPILYIFVFSKMNGKKSDVVEEKTVKKKVVKKR